MCFGFVIDIGAQDISHHKHYSIEDGLAERSVSRILRDDLGRFWIFGTSHIQLFNGSGFENVEIPDELDLRKVTTIEKMNDGSIVLYSAQDDSWIVRYPDFRFTRLDTSYLLSHGDLWAIEKIENSGVSLRQITAENERYDLFRVDCDIQEIASCAENRLCALCTDGQLFAHIDRRTKLVQDEVESIIGWHQDELWVNTINGIKKISKDAKESVVDTAKYSRVMIRNDQYGNSLIGLSNNPRRITQFRLIRRTGEIIDYSALCPDDISNTIRDYYADDFTNEILIGTYNGLHYYKIRENIETYFGDGPGGEGNFGAVMWWVIERANGEIYSARENEGMFRLDSDEPYKLFPSERAPNVYKGNYQAEYFDDIDVLLSNGIQDGENHIYFYDFKIPPIALSAQYRYYAFLRFDEDHIVLMGGTPDSAALGFFRISEKRLINERIIPEIEGRVYCMHPCDSGWLVGSRFGLYFIETDSLAQLQSSVKINDLMVIDIIKSGDNWLIGSYGDGLHILDREFNFINEISDDDGLMSTQIMAMTHGREGNIWVSTMEGVSILDSQFQIKRGLTRFDGLSTNEMNNGAILSATNGNIYMGSPERNKRHLRKILRIYQILRRHIA